MLRVPRLSLGPKLIPSHRIRFQVLVGNRTKLERPQENKVDIRKE